MKINKYYNSVLSLLFTRTARNTYLVFAGNSLAMIFAFFYVVILFRVLNLSDFGKFSALFTFLLIILDIADIGIGLSLSRFLPKFKSDKQKMKSFLKAAFVVQFFFVLIILCLFFLFSGFISDLLFHQKDLSYLIKLNSLAILAAVLSTFFMNALSAQEKFLQASIVSSIIGMSRFLFILPLIVFGQVTLANVVVMQIISFLSAAIIGLIFINPQFLKIKTEINYIKILLSFSSFLAFSKTLTSIASRLDVLMLIAFTSATTAGIYSTASRVASLYTLFTGSFVAVVGPRISAIFDLSDFKKYIMKVILATLSLIVTILLFIFIADPFMLILFGDKALPSVQILRYLLVSMIFFVGSIPAVATALYFLHKPFILTVNSILQLILIIIGNIFFIPKFGVIGPALTLIVAYAASFFSTTIMSFYYLKARKGSND